MTEAQTRINQIEEMIEKKEIYIADFYFKTNDYFAAKSRYEDILVVLKNEKERPRIMARIVESEEQLNKTK